MELPFVSVIIPVFNDGKRLSKCLQSLYCQTYPYSRYEVIVVDNGSTENIISVCQKFPFVRYQHEEKRGSYNARNCGVRAAKGEILAFIDSDCVPISDWIRSGVRSLESAELVAGHIEFTFQYRNAVEYMDSLMHLNQERYAQKGYAATGNAFTHSWVFEKIGLFNGAMLSLGDREWGERVSAAGYRVVYAADAFVYHPARHDLKVLLRKIRAQTQYKAKLNRWTIKDILTQLQPIHIGFYVSLSRNSMLTTYACKLQFFRVFYVIKYAVAWEMLKSTLPRPKQVT